jgi:para-nitrobenzyl esterase
MPRHPFAPDAPPISARVPLIVSTTLDERTYREARFDMSWDEVTKYLAAIEGVPVDDVIAMYRRDAPEATPYLIHARIMTDRGFRRMARTLADRKATQASGGGAPVWSYLWSSPSPAYGGRYGATHAVDNSYSMHDVRLALSGPQAENVRLADEIASAWVAFAASGDPNNPKTPAWPAYDQQKRMTMVFARPSGAVSDPRGAFAALWDKIDA